MGQRRTTVSMAGALVALTLLTGCATEHSGASAGPSSGSTQVGTAPGAPTGAVTDAASGDGAGAGPDGDSPPQYGLNKRHHERTELTAAAAAELDAARAEVEREIAELPTPVLEPAVATVLDGVGAPSPWIVTTVTGEKVLFEAQVEMTGCLIGEVQQDGTAAVAAAGWVLDGGCHALDGH
ncbi:hypothetical protein DEJ28_08725 [Curtobacterium sp. MCPF17_002]|uniref:hypothetical protein n=1 Tax=Curtobacterium sp. MCPF17_002 TaxID=2175645 RepID=UPI000DA8501E|nr:hypothetical protein [Curtobacterium sp. MCPF17_002]WIB79168.1 hypothetical protein DEJ28_08725 [Curtobacterium sp. MCPF17_002]